MKYLKMKVLIVLLIVLFLTIGAEARPYYDSISSAPTNGAWWEAFNNWFFLGFGW